MRAPNAKGPSRPRRTARRRARPLCLRRTTARRAGPSPDPAPPAERIDSSSSSTTFDSRRALATATSARTDGRTCRVQSSAAPPAVATFPRASRSVSPDSRQSARASRKAGSEGIMAPSSRDTRTACTSQNPSRASPLAVRCPSPRVAIQLGSFDACHEILRRMRGAGSRYERWPSSRAATLLRQDDGLEELVVRGRHLVGAGRVIVATVIDVLPPGTPAIESNTAIPYPVPVSRCADQTASSSASAAWRTNVPAAVPGTGRLGS